MRNAILTLISLLILPFSSFSQKFQNYRLQKQYEDKVSIVKRYEYQIANFDTTNVNAILTKINEKAPYCTEYTATGQVRSFQTNLNNYVGKSTYEYDKFDNPIKIIRTVLSADTPPEIINYDYDYKNKSVIIFKNDKKYKFRQYNAQNRLILEETFVEYPHSKRKEHHKQEYTYKSDGAIIQKSYKDGELRGSGVTTLDSLSQLQTKIAYTPNGAIRSKTITQMDGQETIEILFTTNANSLRYFIFKDDKGNTIKKYSYDTERKRAYIYEYEIDYYKP